MKGEKENQFRKPEWNPASLGRLVKVLLWGQEGWTLSQWLMWLQVEQFYNEAEWNQTWEPSGKVSFFLTTDQPSPRIKVNQFKQDWSGNLLAVQRLVLHGLTAKGAIPDQGTKIPQAAHSVAKNTKQNKTKQKVKGLVTDWQVGMRSTWKDLLTSETLANLMTE